LFQPGRNCWRTARADRLGVVVDAEAYFRALAEVLPQARHSILMVGWEFDSRTRLLRGTESRPDGLPPDGLPPDGLPNEIGALLDRLAHRRRGLDIRVLIWDSAMLYAINREFGAFIKMDWLTHSRLRFRLDDGHPIGASHHQKIVVIDDRLAFIGGLDISSQRWDSRAHFAVDPRRRDPAFPDYPPFHDVMAAMTGDAAAALAEICRERWYTASGERLAPSPAASDPAPWPSEVAELCGDVEVAIARTSPAWDGEPMVREAERLYHDMIAVARHSIFIENQYFASRSVALALERRLRRDDCPEMVVIGPGEPVSLLERSTMGVARSRLYRRLQAADRHGRLRYYWVTSGGRDVKVHSKVMVVDDRWLRVGSANLANRSMGLDTECDVVVEAPAAARACRLDLLAEHLGVSPERVADAEARLGGSHAAIASLTGGAHRLVPLDSREPDRVVPIIAHTGVPDPEQAMETLLWIERAAPGPSRRPLARRVLISYGVLALLALATALWPLAPPELWEVARPWVERLARLRDQPAAAAGLIGAFLLGGMVRFPPSLLAMAAAAVMGTGFGVGVSLLGVMASAALLFGCGRALGRARVRRLGGWKVNRVSRSLGSHGMVSVALLRLAPVAAFSVVNLVAGAAGVRFRDFVLGTLVGMTPSIIAMSVLGDQAVRVLRRPDLANAIGLGLAAMLVIGAGLALVNRLARARARRGRWILEV
jgi:phosphatidylserine/phosphatidylglycerophosphate/cardiolipin synthase-like enzyme/uncharacterized membrane protein YdjX (TVP38/TMEM64 family)